MYELYRLEGLYESAPVEMKKIVSLETSKKGLPMIKIGHSTRLFDDKREAFMFLKAFMFGWITRDNS